MTIRNLRPCSILLLLLWLWFGCRTISITPDDTLQQNAAFLEQQGRMYWEKRAQPENASKARYFLDQAYRLRPDDTELAVILSRAYYFEAHYIEPDPAKKDTLFLTGAAIARAVVINSLLDGEASATAESDTLYRLQKAIDAADRSLVPALYWWAANYGRYLINKPVLTRMEHRELLETIMHRVLALNPDYFYGGPNRFFGTFYARLPGVELSRSRSYFEQSIAQYPDYLATYVLRAQYYHTKSGNREQFQADLKHVIAADPTAIPEVMPENLFEQEIAKKLLDQESLLFE
jgi:hypothetical protein